MAAVESSDGKDGPVGGERPALRIIGLAAAAVFIACWFSVEFVRGPDRIVAIWLANAVLLAILLKNPVRLWPGLMIAGYFGNVTAGLLAGDEMLVALSLPLGNMVEVAICAVTIARLGWKVDFLQSGFLVKFGAVVFGPAAIAGALIGAGLLSFHFGTDFLSTLMRWYCADAVGLIAVTPVLLVTRVEEFLALVGRGKLSRTVAILGGIAATNIVVFSQTTTPLLFLVYPALLFAAFQLGFAGVAVSIVITAVAGCVSTLQGTGPLSVMGSSLQQEILVLQIFLVVAVLMNLIVNAVLHERAALVNALRTAKMAAECSEAERAASQSLLSVTLESMDQGLMIIGADDSVPVCNHRALELLDLPASAITAGMTYSQISALQRDRGDFVSMPEEFETLVAEPLRAPAPIVFERTQANGRVIETRSNSLPTGGVVRTYTDISARRAAERRIAEREYLYRLLAENSTDVISRLRLDGTCTYASPAAGQVLGYPAHAVMNRPYLALVVPEDRQAAAEIFGRLVDGAADVANMTFRCRRPDGKLVHVEASLKLVRHPETGQPVEIVATGRDVTEREEHASEVERAREEAERARARAEQANEVKSNFIASMSHEIRTPLNSIIGFAAILLDRRALNDEVRRQIALIQNAAQALLTVVNDVLDFSKMEAEQLVINPHPFAPLALVDNMVSIVRNAAEGKGLSLSMRLGTGLPEWVVGDEGRLGQVLLNLLNNAIKFTDRGSVSLNVTSKTAEGGRISMIFEVADTGIGISDDNLDRLFVRFSQVDGSIQRRYGGTGLGLAICKRLVELMGGELGVKSAAGKGSIFWFSAPLEVTEAPSGLPAQPELATRSARILLAEDLEINQEIAATMLASAGHSVTIVGDGVQAVEQAKKERFDLILMDIQMPGMDGVTAARQIRSLAGEAGKVPIVALTANVFADQIARFKEAGMNDHIGKPFDKHQLNGVVARWVAETPKEGSQSPLAGEDFDEEAYEEIKSLFESERLARYLDTLGDMLRDILAATAEQGDIDRRAHKLVSTAGMLGFRRLADLAVALENACEEGEDVEPFLSDLRAVAEETFGRIDRLRPAA